ncbi:hypothetical protein BJ508DRAFT_327507 [Ascobolus immersus RN42]|uniref:Uncharacterized protein n=1 Tax=Ascobolus immersus RN42 TaxID=1160509 RepID=A0A3N4I472_ASCIM|nr:hypothetical protein BJ508DRAFT_327507 [Ascobolus immersus RN42]
MIIIDQDDDDALAAEVQLLSEQAFATERMELYRAVYRCIWTPEVVDQYYWDNPEQDEALFSNIGELLRDLEVEYAWMGKDKLHKELRAGTFGFPSKPRPAKVIQRVKLEVVDFTEDSENTFNPTTTGNPDPPSYQVKRTIEEKSTMQAQEVDTTLDTMSAERYELCCCLYRIIYDPKVFGQKYVDDLVQEELEYNLPDMEHTLKNVERDYDAAGIKLLHEALRTGNFLFPSSTEVVEVDENKCGLDESDDWDHDDEDALAIRAQLLREQAEAVERLELYKALYRCTFKPLTVGLYNWNYPERDEGLFPMMEELLRDVEVEYEPIIGKEKLHQELRAGTFSFPNSEKPEDEYEYCYFNELEYHDGLYD